MKQEQKLTQTFESPAKENFCTINGRQYATGIGGTGLYELLDSNKAYFQGEAVLLIKDFVLKDKLHIEKEIISALDKI